MSETEQEQQAAPDTAPEAPITEEQVQEAQEGEEPEETPGTAEEPADEPTEPATEDGEAQAQAFSEKEIEKRLEKISRENDRHTKRVEEIMEEGATDLLQCPLCSHFVAGWIYPPNLAPLPDEAVDSSLAVLGFLKPRTLKHASNTKTCPECDGEGEVETGSKRQGYERMDCGACNAAGYVLVGPVIPDNGHAPEVPTLSGPTVHGLDVSTDPEVQHLRDRGFIVVPPVNAPAEV